MHSNTDQCVKPESAFMPGISAHPSHLRSDAQHLLPMLPARGEIKDWQKRHNGTEKEVKAACCDWLMQGVGTITTLVIGNSACMEKTAGCVKINQEHYIFLERKPSHLYNTFHSQTIKIELLFQFLKTTLYSLSQ